MASEKAAAVDQDNMSENAQSNERRPFRPVTADYRRKPVRLPAWAGTSSRLKTRSAEAKQQRCRGNN